MLGRMMVLARMPSEMMGVVGVRMGVASISPPTGWPAMPTTVPIPAVSPGPPIGPAPGIGDSNIVTIVAAIAGVRRQELLQAHQPILVGIHPPEESRRTLLVLDPRGCKELVQGQESVVIGVEPVKYLPG
jgi:hypothetical protein